MSKIILKGFIVVPQADLIAVKAELENHIYLTRSEIGCLVFEVTQNKANPYHFAVYEEFIDNASFQKHQARVRSSTWGKITANVERHYTVTGTIE